MKNEGKVIGVIGGFIYMCCGKSSEPRLAETGGLPLVDPKPARDRHYHRGCYRVYDSLIDTLNTAQLIILQNLLLLL